MVELSKTHTYEARSNIRPADSDHIIYRPPNIFIVATIFPTAQNKKEINTEHTLAWLPSYLLFTCMLILVSIFSSPVCLHRCSYTGRQISKCVCLSVHIQFIITMLYCIYILNTFNMFYIYITYFYLIRIYVILCLNMSKCAMLRIFCLLSYCLLQVSECNKSKGETREKNVLA